MQTIWQDIRYGLRMLMKRPGFTLIAVITLALGIGANTAIFSVIYAVMLRPLPYWESERLVMIWETDNPGREPGSVAPANFLDWRAQSRTLEDMAASRHWGFNLTGRDRPEQLNGAVVSTNLFPVLGVKPILGRAFRPEEGQPGSSRVVILSEGLWQRRFGADPNIIGQELTLNAERFTVVGVMPEEVRYPEETQLWVAPRRLVPDFPLNPTADATQIRGHQYMRVIGRLQPGATLKEAQAEMDTIARRLAQQYAASNADAGVLLVPLRDQLFGNLPQSLRILFGAVGFVLLIACANVANLLLARAAVRQKEMAIRAALGAGRIRLARQFLSESVLLALLGGCAGLLLALWGIGPLAALGPQSLRAINDLGVDGRILAFTLLVSVMTGIFFGLIPALQASKPDLNESLKETGRTAVGGLRRNRIHSLLVVSEIALSLVLLIGASLLIKSFWRLQQVNPGFNPERALTMNLSLPASSYPDKYQQASFFARVLQRIGALPAVESVGGISRLPLRGGNSSRSFTIEGRPPAARNPVADFRVITPGYFRAMGIPLMKGRVFNEKDNQHSPGVAIVSEAMARRYWPNEDVIGKRLTISLSDGDLPCEVIGLVGNVRHSGLEIEAAPEMYVSYLQSPWPSMTLVVRSAADAGTIMAAVREGIWAEDKNQPISSVTTMEQLITASTAARRFNMLLLALFAGVAVILAAVGIYGVMAYSVSLRRQEIGIRMALGARSRDVFKLVAGQGLRLTLTGVVIGLAVASVLTRLLSNLLYGVSATDPATFVAIALLLALISMLACYIPARRATKVDPMVALKYE
ncbi:MAG: ABC transporter permease [Acidobacteria bacterium]|nr:ABC transporter permease [Acidobacteriota bacterium]